LLGPNEPVVFSDCHQRQLCHHWFFDENAD